jgi:hypothetical protein
MRLQPEAFGIRYRVYTRLFAGARRTRGCILIDAKGRWLAAGTTVHTLSRVVETDA